MQEKPTKRLDSKNVSAYFFEPAMNLEHSELPIDKLESKFSPFIKEHLLINGLKAFNQALIEVSKRDVLSLEYIVLLNEYIKYLLVRNPVINDITEDDKQQISKNIKPIIFFLNKHGYILKNNGIPALLGALVDCTLLIIGVMKSYYYIPLFTILFFTLRSIYERHKNSKGLLLKVYK